jgi:hypothetical protein
MFLYIVASILLLILAFAWYRKNQRVRKLERELTFLRAKVKMEKLAAKYEVMTEELKDIRKEEAAVEENLVKIETSLKEKLKKDMTAEEIVDKFREIGLTG